jgi:hypothetical protein
MSENILIDDIGTTSGLITINSLLTEPVYTIEQLKKLNVYILRFYLYNREKLIDIKNNLNLLFGKDLNELIDNLGEDNKDELKLYLDNLLNKEQLGKYLNNLLNEDTTTGDIQSKNKQLQIELKKLNLKKRSRSVDKLLSESKKDIEVVDGLTGVNTV